MEIFMIGRRLADVLVIFQNVQQNRQIVLIELVELIFILREFFLSARQMFQQRAGLVPVSYTHLDVYKRQAGDTRLIAVYALV